jgi:Tol biopolymer transport system component
MVRLVGLGAVAVLVFATGASSSPSATAVNGRLAFSMRSDLFTIRPDGGGLRRLTSGAGVDDDPAWSPDGRWIAFTRTLPKSGQSSIWVVRETGGAPRLLVRNARFPEWSPSGRRLAVVRGRPDAFSVWTVAFAGGEPRLASAQAAEVDWSPSGRELAVIRPDGIAIVTVASGKIRHLSDLTRGESLDWSPVENKLLVTVDDAIVTVSVADGSMQTVVSRPPDPKPPDAPNWCNGYLGPAAWSPDGQWIAFEETFCAYDGDWFVRSSIEVFNTNGDFQNSIDNEVWGRSPNLGPYNFVWSPNSRSLAFLDDAVYTSGAVYLETAPATPKAGATQERLKAGLSQNAGAPSWQRTSR